MKIAIVTGRDRRNRHKFISMPLFAGNHDVRVIETTSIRLFFHFLVGLGTGRRPDIIVFIGVGVKELLALLVTKFTRIPFVLRLGGDRLRDLDSVADSMWRNNHYLLWAKFRLERRISQCFLKQVSNVIVVNDALKMRICDQIKAKHKIFVIPQFSEGSPVQKDYRVSSPLQLITVTNFRFSEKAEGVVWLIAALAKFVNNTRISVNFRIAGEGLHLKDVQKHLDSMVPVDLLSVEILGFVENLDSFYRETDVFVYRSFHDATPNVILESKRYGLPVIANECEEFRFLIKNSETGFLYEDENQFFNFLSDVISCEVLRERIGNGASYDHCVRFSVASTLKLLEKGFNEITR